MFLTLLKCAVKAALHGGVDEWALESGLPQEVVKEMRARRLALAAQVEARADARAALALGVDDDTEERRALPMPSAARVTTVDAGDECPPPGDESALLHWVCRQREHQIAWADIARITTSAGHDVGEDALRMRFRRWREKSGPPNSDPPPAA